MKTFLFDLDGTLVDSMGPWSDSVLTVLKNEGVAYPADIIRIITPLGMDGTADYLRALGVKKSRRELLDAMRSYALDAYAHTILLKPGVREFLFAAKAKNVRLAVLTASPHITTDACLRHNRVWDLFEVVWSCDDFAGMKKNEPFIYREAAKKLNVSVGEIAFFDDNLLALRAAKEAGTFPVGVFDASSSSDTDEIRRTARAYCRNMTELVNRSDLFCLTNG